MQLGESENAALGYANPCPAVITKIGIRIIATLFPAEESETLRALPEVPAMCGMILTLAERQLDVVRTHAVHYVLHLLFGDITEIPVGTLHKKTYYPSTDLF